MLQFFNKGTRWIFGDTRKRRKCSADFSSLFCHIHEVDGTITAFSTVGHFDKPSPPIMHFSWQRSRMPTSWTLQRRHMAVSHAIEFMLRTPDLLKSIVVCMLCLSYDMEVGPQWFLLEPTLNSFGGATHAIRSTRGKWGEDTAILLLMNIKNTV